MTDNALKKQFAFFLNADVVDRLYEASEATGRSVTELLETALQKTLPSIRAGVARGQAAEDRT